MSKNISPEEIIIRLIKKSDSIEELTDLLHRGYKTLADMGLRYMATHQDANVTNRRIKNADCFVAEYDGKILGTVTFYVPRLTHGSPWLDREDVAEFGQFAIDPEYQRRGIGTRMVKHVEEYARKRGAAHLALDTSEKATHLIAWYEKLGYRFIEFVNWEVTNYRSVVMSKRLDGSQE
jgi:GNAT superfamily N-acetyltransferase